MDKKGLNTTELNDPTGRQVYHVAANALRQNLSAAEFIPKDFSLKLEKLYRPHVLSYQC
jgi:hypothetical protein